MSSIRRIRLSRRARTGTSRNRTHALVAILATVSLVFSGLVMTAPANAEDTTTDTTTVVETATVEEPAAEEVVSEEPAAEEVVSEEPAAEEVVSEEPAAEEVVSEEPAAEEVVSEEPAAEEVVSEEPAAEEVVSEEDPGPVLLGSGDSDPCVDADVDGAVPSESSEAECETAPSTLADAEGGTISTPKSTYMAGSTVSINGDAWMSDDEVAVVVTDEGGESVFEGAASVDAEGVIGMTFVLPKSATGAMGVLATGAQSQGTASTVFDVARLAKVTISSDQADYQPGALVTLSGTGWSGDTAVHIYVNDATNSSWQRNVDVTPDDKGRITDTFSLPKWFVADYTVVATGLDTDREATASFTDAVIPASVKALTWETKNTGKWIEGTLNAQNSNYKEGDVVPFVIDMGTLPTSGNPYYAPVCRDFLTSGVYGYSYIDDFNASWPSTVLGTEPSLPATITDSVSHFDGTGMDILQVEDYGPSGDLDGNFFDCGSTQRLTIVKFDVTGSANYLAWGGHLSFPGEVVDGAEVPYTKSAGWYSGGSLQMRLASPDKTAGINPGAIVQFAFIKVNKIVQPATGATADQWSFTVSGTGYNSTRSPKIGSRSSPSSRCRRARSA